MKTKFKCTLDVGTVAMSAASGLYGIVTLHKMDSNCLAKLSATMDVLHNGWNETTHFSSTRFEKNKEETITATIY
ncbi:Uncharacterized protein APZ42_028488 [Daphnia magna]|uniref:Uncharacterized protein n=1 Tax=Daphnia magna TaxID=35525 RepID=A0A164QGL1_9CRUS|nr:Uncharacterized protein APZ42_028488 [Daphnia magna]